MLEDLLESFIPLFLLVCVNLAVIFRRIGKLKVPAWTAFMIAALIIILIQPGAYDRAIVVIGTNVHVLIFLFGMFVLVTSLDISGSLEERGKFLLLKGESPLGLLFSIHFGLGLAASLLVNDTVAIIGPTLLIAFTKQVRKYPKPYILAVCYALTFGSALLPTGNPQNYILAIAGDISFLEFGIWALFPTFFSLLGSYILLKYLLKSEFNEIKFPVIPAIAEKHELESLQRPSEVFFIVLVIGLILSSFITQISITLIILLITGTFLFLVNERDKILEKLNWEVILFFMGMFVVLDAVVSSNFFVNIISPFLNQLDFNFTSLVIFIIILFLLSQVLSNVPVAILIAGILPRTPLDHPLFWMTAALTTTFAGATTVLGAASNIIVIDIAAERGVEITWWEFTKFGIPISILSLIPILSIGLLFFILG